MPPVDALSGLIGRVGSYTQLGSLALISLFCAALYYSRRPARFFGRWAVAWALFSCAVTAVVVRYSPATSPIGVPFVQLGEGAGLTRGLYYVYMCAKIGFLAFLFSGTRLFARPGASSPSWWGLALGSLVVGATIVAVTPTLNRAMVYQSVVAVPVLAACAALCFTVPPPDRTLGSRALAAAFLAHTVLWVAYALAFDSAESPDGAPLFRVLTTYNSFLDAVLQTLIAYGMVLVVTEQTTRESVAELDRAHQALRRSAYYDSLSGAYNRYAFSEGMGLEEAGGQVGTVVVLDVDHLKPINDGLGHDAGDALIQSVAVSIRTALGPRDAFYRWGGDEFLLVLSLCDEPTARERLASALNAAPLLKVAGVAVPVRASFGCAEFSALSDLPAAITRADRRMYESKSARRVSRDTPVQLRAFTG
jgi:diguanylate cyclase (GGDEF)-like protein